MNLSDMTLTRFAELLGSDAPAPGGGSAAALEGALGASLTAMVCALTKDKKKFAEYRDLAVETEAAALELKDRFLYVMELDTQAFNEVAAVFSMPKNTPEEKAARSDAMQEALKGSTATPLEMMDLSRKALELVSRVVGKSSTSAVSDLGVAALSLKAACQGAWLNVLINIASFKDRELAEHCRSIGEASLSRVCELADQIYAAVLKQI